MASIEDIAQQLTETLKRYSADYIEARLEGDLIRVDVADSGVGIPEEALPKIFDKFYRVKENAKVAKGTGMGLAMVQRILEIHNAEIKVKSRPGEGSCFSVFIPAAE